MLTNVEQTHVRLTLDALMKTEVINVLVLEEQKESHIHLDVHNLVSKQNVYIQVNMALLLFLQDKHIYDFRLH
jgi:thymidylate kinase